MLSSYLARGGGSLYGKGASRGGVRQVVVIYSSIQGDLLDSGGPVRGRYSSGMDLSRSVNLVGQKKRSMYYVFFVASDGAEA